MYNHVCGEVIGKLSIPVIILETLCVAPKVSLWIIAN
jgi:hypothetical protein